MILSIHKELLGLNKYVMHVNKYIQNQSVMTQTFVLWVAIFPLWVEWRSVSMEPGELCVMTAGEMKMQESYVNNLNSQLTVIKIILNDLL